MLFLALRHLTSKKRQTVLTLLGIMLGTAAFVAISGMMLGFQGFIINQLINNDAHIRISAREELITERSLDPEFYPEAAHIFWASPPSGRRDDAFIDYPQGWIERLTADPEVIAYSQQLVAETIFRRGKVSTSARLIGSDPTKQVQVSNIEDYMIEGKFTDVGHSGNRIIVGEGLLKKLGARTSENILVSTGKGTVVPFKVAGVFRLGVKMLDDTTAFGSLADVQKINQTPSQVSDIAIRIREVSEAAAIASSWATLSDDKVLSWDQANEGTMSVFKTQNIVRNGMTLSILVVAGFGIYNILNMAVSQRRREIAILRSMGYEPNDILKLFLIQGVVLGAAGGTIGLLVGYVLSLAMTQIEISSDRMIGMGRMIISFEPMIYVRAFLLAFLASTFASLLPARAAGRLEPITIIRSEGM